MKLLKEYIKENILSVNLGRVLYFINELGIISCIIHIICIYTLKADSIEKMSTILLIGEKINKITVCLYPLLIYRAYEIPSESKKLILHMVVQISITVILLLILTNLKGINSINWT